MNIAKNSSNASVSCEGNYCVKLYPLDQCPPYQLPSPYQNLRDRRDIENVALRSSILKMICSFNFSTTKHAFSLWHQEGFCKKVPKGQVHPLGPESKNVTVEESSWLNREIPSRRIPSPVTGTFSHPLLCQGGCIDACVAAFTQLQTSSRIPKFNREPIRKGALACNTFTIKFLFAGLGRRIWSLAYFWTRLPSG